MKKITFIMASLSFATISALEAGGYNVQKGWNLLGTGLSDTEISVDNIIDDVEKVFLYDSATGKWSSATSSSKEFKTIGSGKGFWANSTNGGIVDATTSSTPKQSILRTYADIATQNYNDAYNDAVSLKTAIEAFVASPTNTTLQVAKDAWLNSRESYGTTEIFRLSEGPIDAEKGWVNIAYGAHEGQINAWPLDENLIDYTINASGTRTSGNIIDTRGKFTPTGGTEIDTTTISVASLTALNENGGDANVATGYHAIEFLLWGQDQDYSSFITDAITNGALTAGQRAVTDYTTDKNADRRKAYLQASTQKLVNDLKVVKDAWDTTTSVDCSIDATGCYRGAILGILTGADASKNISEDSALKTIMGGMGVFIKSELANERIAVAVLTPSEEDEHSCFSDNTHRDIALNYQGFINILKGEYKGSSKGTSLYSQLNSSTKNAIDALIKKIDAGIASVNSVATSTEHFDYQIKSTSSQNRVIITMKNDMRALGDKMVEVASTLNVSITEDDVTDSDETKI